MINGPYKLIDQYILLKNKNQKLENFRGSSRNRNEIDNRHGLSLESLVLRVVETQQCSTLLPLCFTNNIVVIEVVF